MTTKQVPLFKRSTQQDFNLDSYFCLYTKTDSSNISEDTWASVFDSDNYSSLNYNLNCTEDFTYDITTGNITVHQAGDYFIYLSGPVDYTGGGPILVEVRLSKNGLPFIYNGIGVRINSVLTTPKDVSTHTISTLSAGDVLTAQAIFYDSPDPSDTIVGTLQMGWHITILRVWHDWGTVRYTADADATTAAASSIDLYDVPANNGTIAQASNNMGFVAAEGAFMAAGSGAYMIFSTLMYKAADDGDGFHKIALDGTAIDELSMGWKASADDSKLTEMSLLKEGISKTNKIKARYQSNDEDFTAQAGSCFSLFHIGPYFPGSYVVAMMQAGRSAQPKFGTAVDENDSDDFADATSDDGTNIFHQDNWGGAITLNNTTDAAGGIVYSPINGRFFAGSPGDYFVSIALGMMSDDLIGPGADMFKIKKNGSEIFNSETRSSSNQDPENLTIALILRAESADDYFSFHLHEHDGDLDDGTAISIFKLNSRIKDDTTSPSQVFADDFTINTLDIDHINKQYNRVVEQVPMKLGVRGPISLRGRRANTKTTFPAPPSIGKGSKD